VPSAAAPSTPESSGFHGNWLPDVAWQRANRLSLLRDG
jgi:hypothetical protein